MADYKAKLSYLKISPRKTRLVADLVRGQNALVAQNQLQYSTKRASVSLYKLLNSAISNAKNMNEDLDESSLYIKEIRVNEGPTYKRYMPVARGAAHEIHKKTSHITIILSTKEKAQSESSKSKVKEKNNKEKVKENNKK